MAVESTLGQREVNSRSQRDQSFLSFETRKKTSHNFVEVIVQSGDEKNMEIHAQQRRSERDNKEQMGNAVRARENIIVFIDI